MGKKAEARAAWEANMQRPKGRLDTGPKQIARPPVPLFDAPAPRPPPRPPVPIFKEPAPPPKAAWTPPLKKDKVQESILPSTSSGMMSIGAKINVAPDVSDESRTPSSPQSPGLHRGIRAGPVETNCACR